MENKKTYLSTIDEQEVSDFTSSGSPDTSTPPEIPPPDIGEIIREQIERTLEPYLDEIKEKLDALIEDEERSHRVPKETDLLTIEEVADWLNVSVSHLYNLRNRGELVPKKIGGSVRYSRGAIRSYLRSRASAKRSKARRQRTS